MRKSDCIGVDFQNGGLFTSEKEWSHEARVVDSNEILIITEGKVFLEEDGTQMCLCPGDFCLLHANVPHRGWKKSTQKTAFYWFHFYGEKFDKLNCGHLKNRAAVIQLAQHLLQISATPAYIEHSSDCAFFVLMSEIEHQINASLTLHSFASGVDEYIRSHSDEILSASTVAAHFGYHPDTLSRILKREYGKTVNQCIAEHRLNRACLLLRTTNLPIKAIADQLGYSDVNLFTKFFYYHYHCSPLSVRNSFFNQHTNHF